MKKGFECKGNNYEHSILNVPLGCARVEEINYVLKTIGYICSSHSCVSATIVSRLLSSLFFIKLFFDNCERGTSKLFLNLFFIFIYILEWHSIEENKLISLKFNEVHVTFVTDMNFKSINYCLKVVTNFEILKYFNIPIFLYIHVI